MLCEQAREELMTTEINILKCANGFVITLDKDNIFVCHTHKELINFVTNAYSDEM